MTRILLVALALLAALPAAASDFHLLVGFRSVVAGLIRDEGYACADVKAMAQLGLEEDGAVARILCGPVGRPAADRAFRVIFHADNEVSVKPLAPQRPTAGTAE